MWNAQTMGTNPATTANPLLGTPVGNNPDVVRAGTQPSRQTQARERASRRNQQLSELRRQRQQELHQVAQQYKAQQAQAQEASAAWAASQEQALTTMQEAVTYARARMETPGTAAALQEPPPATLTARPQLNGPAVVGLRGGERPNPSGVARPPVAPPLQFAEGGVTPMPSTLPRYDNGGSTTTPAPGTISPTATGKLAVWDGFAWRVVATAAEAEQASAAIVAEWQRALAGQVDPNGRLLSPPNTQAAVGAVGNATAPTGGAPASGYGVPIPIPYDPARAAVDEAIQGGRDAAGRGVGRGTLNAPFAPQSAPDPAEQARQNYAAIMDANPGLADSMTPAKAIPAQAPAPPFAHLGTSPWAAWGNANPEQMMAMINPGALPPQATPTIPFSAPALPSRPESATEREARMEEARRAVREGGGARTAAIPMATGGQMPMPPQALHGATGIFGEGRGTRDGYRAEVMVPPEVAPLLRYAEGGVAAAPPPGTLVLPLHETAPAMAALRATVPKLAGTPVRKRGKGFVPERRGAAPPAPPARLKRKG